MRGGKEGICLNLFCVSLPRGAGVGVLPAAEPRLVRLKKVQVELGVQICGGNLSGIFVESLDEDSPAKSPDGVLPGDLILEVHAVFLPFILVIRGKKIEQLCCLILCRKNGFFLFRWWSVLCLILKQ